MLELRKKIREILKEMGFKNGFLVKTEPVAGALGGSITHVIIKDWEADPAALVLKKKIERGVDAKVVVSFTGPGIVCSPKGSGVVCKKTGRSAKKKKTSS